MSSSLPSTEPSSPNAHTRLSHPVVRLLFTALPALAGGLLFKWLNIPLPWLLGPMSFMLAGTRALPFIKPSWPGLLRNGALITIGYSIGLSFTVETLGQMRHQLPTMVLMTTLLLLFCVLIAVIISKLSGISFPTILMGSIPGGLNQVLVLAEDTKGIDITIITFLQVSRLLMIIFGVPLLIFSPLFGASHAEGASGAIAAGRAAADWSGMDAHILLYGAICVSASLLAKRYRFPSAFVLAPMIVTAALHLSGVHGPVLPLSVLNTAQFIIGTYVGLLLKPENLTNKLRMASLALLSGVLLMGGAFGLSVLLGVLHDVSPATSFLSLAPGGMDQMGLIANEVHADLSIVTCYQVFRTWMIYFAVPPLIRLTFRAIERRERAKQAS
ncbi:membrane protein AbrB duplication [Paenibacillus curdlanolyticus YK9]|uniref:Membrane protein AbrB duplication n=1 Tax=Paenibacillus curdlanolyticus YK9 TaxID=717606 RepID=E0IG30_9BACL|nr:AbrB family transcriptional regulator [Paenibacillus curdlanolyticus]EFM08610.1 membrane protein AbrB duplication [Paenibacillus curdlanolyticus YK9]